MKDLEALQKAVGGAAKIVEHSIEGVQGVKASVTVAGKVYSIFRPWREVSAAEIVERAAATRRYYGQ